MKGAIKIPRTLIGELIKNLKCGTALFYLDLYRLVAVEKSDTICKGQAYEVDIGEVIIDESSYLQTSHLSEIETALDELARCNYLTYSVLGLHIDKHIYRVSVNDFEKNQKMGLGKAKKKKAEVLEEKPEEEKVRFGSKVVVTKEFCRKAMRHFIDKENMTPQNANAKLKDIFKKMDDYCLANGKHYDDYEAAFRQWWRREKQNRRG